MSTPCTTCGEPLADDDVRCPTCGALAPPPIDEPRGADPPPWSIPIREPAVVAPEGRRTSPARAIALVALAVAAFLLTVVLGSRLLGDDGRGTTSGGAASDEVALDQTGGLDAGSVAADTTATTSTTTAPTTSSSVPHSTTTADPATTAASAAAPSTTVAPAPSGTGDVPALSTSFRGWIAQLTSVPYAAGADGLAEEWERVRASVPGAVAARSDDWAGLRDGFWVLVDPGPFSSAEQVEAFCASAGFDGGGACLARELRG